MHQWKCYRYRRDNFGRWTQPMHPGQYCTCLQHKLCSSCLRGLRGIRQHRSMWPSLLERSCWQRSWCSWCLKVGLQGTLQHYSTRPSQAENSYWPGSKSNILSVLSKIGTCHSYTCKGRHECKTGERRRKSRQFPTRRCNMGTPATPILVLARQILLVHTGCFFL